ncbi:MAG: amidohydrolase family protein [Croceibacterium sp.]
MIFDTHAHVLSADRDTYPFSTLRGGARPPVAAVVYPVEQLVADMDEHGISQACLVQRATLYGYDNSYLLDAAARHPGRFAAVAVLDAQDPASPAELERLGAQQRLGGLRLVAPRLTENDTSWLDSPQALCLWDVAQRAGLRVAVILYRRNHAAGSAALAGLARRFTELPIILDHCALPHPSTPEMAFAASEGIAYTIVGGPEFGIDAALGPFADLPHVRFKVTDINFDRLNGAGQDSAEFVRALADRFGAGRFGMGFRCRAKPGALRRKGRPPAACGGRIVGQRTCCVPVGECSSALRGPNSRWVTLPRPLPRCLTQRARGVGGGGCRCCLAR